MLSWGWLLPAVETAAAAIGASTTGGGVAGVALRYITSVGAVDARAGTAPAGVVAVALALLTVTE